MTKKESVNLNTDHPTAAHHTQDGISKNGLFTTLSKYKKGVALCIACAFSGCIFGWDVGTIGGISNFKGFKDRLATNFFSSGEARFPEMIIGLIVSVLNIGCAIGGLSLGKFGDIVGRRYALFSSVLIYAIGIVIQMTSQSSAEWYQFMVGRIITGFAVGGTSVLTPMFISESAPLEIRGSMVVLYQLMITLGILLGNIVNYACNAHQSGDAQWLIPVGLGLLFALMVLAGTALMPESANYLIARGQLDKARDSIATMNNVTPESALCTAEVERITAQWTEDQENKATTKWHEFITGEPRLGRRLAIGMLVMFFQQFTGANYFFYYGTTLFKSVGLQDSYVTAVILGLVNFVSTFFGIDFVERFGRKTCLKFGSVLMGICILIYTLLGSFALTDSDGHERSSVGGVMIAVTCVYIFGFATTWGPVAFVFVSEMFPTRVRATSMALATSCNWFSNFLISLFSPFITKVIGFKYGFVFFGCLCAAAFFVNWFVPETKGLQIEEVDAIFRGNSDEEEGVDELGAHAVTKSSPDVRISQETTGVSSSELVDNIEKKTRE